MKYRLDPNAIHLLNRANFGPKFEWLIEDNIAILEDGYATHIHIYIDTKYTNIQHRKYTQRQAHHYHSTDAWSRLICFSQYTKSKLSIYPSSAEKTIIRKKCSKKL